MKVLLLSDYFYPFTPGGAEWSVYELALAFKNKGIGVKIVTLNYGTVEKEIYKDLEIIRLPFAKKLSGSRKVVNPFWQNNPIFFITSAYHLIKVIREENPDVVHVNGNFLIPAAIIAGFIVKKPIVVTLRDKQLLCSLGKCFFQKDRKKACGFSEYVFTEIPWFIKNYHQSKNIFKLIYVAVGAIWARLSFHLIKYLAKHARTVTAISHSQKGYLENNGFKNVKAVYNTADFAGPQSKVQKNKKVVFAGKLSKGKGGEVLLDAIEKIIKTKKIKFLFAGAINLKDDVNKKSKNILFKKSTIFLGGVDHSRLGELIRDSSAVVMPSIYPEAFGRVALEALAVGVPVVVSDTGALPEVVEDKKTGRVVNIDTDSLAEAIQDVIDNESKYKDNIKKQYPKLKKKFFEEPRNQYINLYEGLLK